MTEEVKFYGQQLWTYWDSSVTENNATLGTFSTRNEYGMNPISLKLDIYNTKTRAKGHVILNHRNVFIFLARFKPISDQLSQLGKQMQADNTVQKSFTVDAKKIIHVTMLFRSEYTLPCFRIALADPKDKSLVDAHKAYIQYYDFMSLVKIMSGFRDDYISTTNSAAVSAAVSDLNDIIAHINHKITMYYSDSKTSNRGVIMSDKYKDPDKQEIDDCSNNVLNELNLEDSTKSESEEEKEEKQQIDEDTVEIPKLDNIQVEMETFVTENKDSMEIETYRGINEDIDHREKKDSAEYKVTQAPLSEEFTSKFLEGSTNKLETIIMGLAHEINPFDSFVSMLSSSLGVTKEQLLPGCSKDDYNAMCYTISRYTKVVLSRHLNTKTKTPLPKSVNPIRYAAQGTTNLNRSILYDIFVYFMYYTNFNSQLKEKDFNTTNNKGIVSFLMKVMMSPFIFSFIEDVDSEETLVKEVGNRFKKYYDLGVFNEIEEKSKSIYGTKVTTSITSITVGLRKLYSVAIDNLEKFHVSNVWQFLNVRMKAVKLDYELLKDKDLNIEQINSILTMERGVDPTSSEFKEEEYKNIPTDILKVFGIESIGPDNTNLKKYLEKIMKDEPHLQSALDIADQMPTSYHEIHGKDLDFSPFSKEALIAFCEWNTETDRELKTSEKKIEEKVKASSLDRATALSMLYRADEETNEEEFGNLAIMVGE